MRVVAGSLDCRRSSLSKERLLVGALVAISGGGDVWCLKLFPPSGPLSLMHIYYERQPHIRVSGLRRLRWNVDGKGRKKSLALEGFLIFHSCHQMWACYLTCEVRLFPRLYCYHGAHERKEFYRGRHHHACPDLTCLLSVVFFPTLSLLEVYLSRLRR